MPTILCKGCPTPEKCKWNCRYPYRHDGPAVHGSKLMDYLISEASLKEDGVMPSNLEKG